MIKKALLIATLVLASLTHIQFEPKETRIPGFTFELARGTCLDNEGNGRLHNGEPYYNYISYKDTSAVDGSEMLTVFMYNPLTTYGDDIKYRWDIVLKKGDQR